MSKELTIIDTPYAALKVAGNLTSILEENLGGASIDVNQLPKVRIPAGGATIWEVEDLGETRGEQEISGIVIAWNETRAYWPGEMTGGGDPPDCSSADAITGISRKYELPDHGGSIPVNILWENNPIPGVQACDTCPFSKFGTAKNGAGQACKKSRRLYVLQKGELLPVLISLSPTSIKPVSDFFLKLTSRMIPLSHVEIGFTLERVQSGGGIKYSKVVTKLNRILSEEEGKAMDSYARQLRPLITPAREALAA